MIQIEGQVVGLDPLLSDTPEANLVYVVVEQQTSFDGLSTFVLFHGGYTDYFEAQHQLRLKLAERKTGSKFFTMPVDVKA